MVLKYHHILIKDEFVPLSFEGLKQCKKPKITSEIAEKNMEAQEKFRNDWNKAC